MTRTPPRFGPLHVLAFVGFATAVAPVSPAEAASPRQVAVAAAAFEEHTGARLVFERGDLPRAAYYDRMPTLGLSARLAAARILTAEAAKYPRGYLGAIGLDAVGVFEACVSDHGDGFREFDDARGGYVYYGVYNGRDAVVACYYSDTQLPLTFHHEVFHAVDSARAGAVDRDAFTADDGRFTRAISGITPYPRARIAPNALAALEARARGAVLTHAVGHYANKSAGEDQAETARWIMSALPDALVQVARRPELAGSQRILHVLAQYQAAVPDGPGLAWFIDVALGRAAPSPPTSTRPDPLAVLAAAALDALDDATAAAARDALDALDAGALDRLAAADRARALRLAAELTPNLMRARVRANADDTAFTVWTPRGGVTHAGNTVLRDDLARFGADAARLANLAARTPRADLAAVARAQLQVARLLARYRAFIASRWSVSRTTDAAFDAARRATLEALPAAASSARAWAARATWSDLAQQVSPAGEIHAAATAPEPARPVAPPRRAAPRRDNPHLAKVDAAVPDRATRAAIRAVQPAAVKVGGGSGVNLLPSGLVLTNAHVAKSVGARYTVLFPDGARYPGRTVAVDATLDLALVALDGARGLPTAPVARAAPRVGEAVVAIGQPGTSTPDGEATNYQPFHVSTGRIRGFLANPLGDQSLGRTKHDAWTYWGHSGSPLFRSDGAIVALHNSWDSSTAMRHAVTWQAIVHFLGEHGVAFERR